MATCPPPATDHPTQSPSGIIAAHRRRVAGAVLRAVLSLAGLPLCIWAIVDQAASLQRVVAVRSANPKERSYGLKRVAEERDRRAGPAVLEVLARERDREILERAAYAAVRIGESDAIGLIRQRSQDGPNDHTKAMLILYAARLSGRDPRLEEWLEAEFRQDSNWARAGCLLGLIELGRPDGGRRLVEAIPRFEPEVRDFALNEFRNRVGSALLETAGFELDWDDLATAPPTDPRWKLLTRYWREQVSVELLNDVLDRQDRKDEAWFQVGRLLHARERVERLFF